MSTVAEIEAAISKLAPEEFAQIRDFVLKMDRVEAGTYEETAEIRAAMAEAEAEYKRGEFFTTEDIKKHCGLK